MQDNTQEPLTLAEALERTLYDDVEYFYSWYKKNLFDRISTKSGAIIEKNMDPGYRKEVRNKNKIDGVLDTPGELAL